MWKEFNSHRTFLYTNMAADSLFWAQIWPPWHHVKTIYFSSVTKDGGYGNTNWNKQPSPALNTPIDISVGKIYKQVLFISALQQYGMYTEDRANYTAVSEWWLRLLSWQIDRTKKY